MTSSELDKWIVNIQVYFLHSASNFKVLTKNGFKLKDRNPILRKILSTFQYLQLPIEKLTAQLYRNSTL